MHRLATHIHRELLRAMLQHDRAVRGNVVHHLVAIRRNICLDQRHVSCRARVVVRNFARNLVQPLPRDLVDPKEICRDVQGSAWYPELMLSEPSRSNSDGMVAMRHAPVPHPRLRRWRYLRRRRRHGLFNLSG
jgi:hypothetical protein